MLDTELYRAIPKQATVGNTLKRTNILINDQHYRYVDRLWQAWISWKRGHAQTPQQIFETYKQGFKGFEAFCLLLVSRALTGNGTTNDRGLEFEADDLLYLQPDSSIQFHSPRECFRCYCKSGNDDCGTEWGMRICGKCSERYPYIQLYDSGILNSWYDRQVGSVDRIFGRNVLAIPCRSDKDTRSFICPACGACS